MNSKLLAPIILLGNDLIFSEDEEENDNTEDNTTEFAESTIPNFSDKQFKAHFRLTAEVFSDLLKKLNGFWDNSTRRGHPELGHDKQVMMTLWYLGNMESFRSVALRFGVSKSTCWDVIGRVCLKLLKVNEKYKIICWPNQEKSLEYIQKFKNVNGFPGVVGAIDGSHIRILPPKKFPNSYYNRKKIHSVLLQGVCNRDKLFLDVYAGELGSIHDANIFLKSDLYQRIQYLDFPNDSHIIGDLAYPLSAKLLTGYKDLGNLDPIKKNYNWRLSSIRVCIEHAFAFLKGRFRRLKYLETRRLDLISLMIVTSCILHNLCILKGDVPDFDLSNMEEEIVNIRYENEANNEGGNRNRARQAGELKRDHIANILYHIDRN